MASEINMPERPRRDKLGTSSRQVGSNDPQPLPLPPPPPSSSSHILVSAGDCSPHTPLEPHGKLCEMAAFPSFT